MKILKFLIFLLMTSISPAHSSLLNNFLSGNFWPKRQDLGTTFQNKKLAEVRFELPVETEEFLREGLELINAPKEALDLCTHRVILQLKKNCNQLSQNDVGKLAVMLMNCELEAEGRLIFPCKPEMTLAQCTLPFDNELQTMHAIMKNRAFAVCAALKQEQFKMATENAVNRLMKLAVSQSQAVQESLQNQRRVNEISMQNIQEFQENHNKIKDSQIQNVEHLNNANVQLQELNNDIQRVFIMNQHTEQKTINIDRLTEDIISKLQNSATSIEQQNKEAQEFMTRFKHIMQIISAMTYTLDLTFNKIEEIFDEIGLQVTQEFLVAFLLNIFYFTCGMIFIIFLEISGRCKQILISLFVFNTLVIYFDSDIPLSSFNIFIWISYTCFHFSGKLKEKIYMISNSLGKFFKNGTKNIERMREKSMSRARSQPPLIEKEKNKPKNKKTDDDEDDEEFNSELAELCGSENKKDEAAAADQQQKNQPVRSETPLNLNRPLTPAMLRVMATDSGRGTPFQMGMSGRVQCEAFTNKGTQCRNAALIGYTKCRVHNYN